MMHDRCYFLLFYQPKNLKEKRKKKEKKRLEILSFNTCVPKTMIRCAVSEICCAMDRQTDGRMDGWTDEFLTVFKFLIVDLFN